MSNNFNEYSELNLTDNLKKTANAMNLIKWLLKTSRLLDSTK